MLFQTSQSTNATARGFEPLRAEPNGFRVHHLNHSVTLSVKPTESARTVCSSMYVAGAVHLRCSTNCQGALAPWPRGGTLDCQLMLEHILGIHRTENLPCEAPTNRVRSLVMDLAPNPCDLAQSRRAMTQTNSHHVAPQGMT